MQRPTVSRFAALGAALLLTQAAALAATVGAQYVTQDTAGNSFVPNTETNAKGFANTMAAFGHTKKFATGNSNFWTGDLVDPVVTGSWDQSFADNVNIYFVSGHGFSQPNHFAIGVGRNNTVDGILGNYSYTRHPTTGNQWWRLGNKNLRMLHMVSCSSVQLAHLSHWDPVAQGLHLITGGDGLMYDKKGRGAAFALYGTFLNLPVKSAWFLARDSRERPVVVAYGTSVNDAVNRRDNERFNWSMARLGTKTHRAWWYINPN